MDKHGGPGAPGKAPATGTAAAGSAAAGAQAVVVGDLREADLPAAAALLAGEGWGFTPKELARLLATGPGLSTAARAADALVGAVMVARHGALAWIGNVVVAPSHRGEGLGEALVAGALARLDRAGVPTVKLVSVPRARSLYERLGFRREAEVATWAAVHERPARRPLAAELVLEEDLPALAALDRAAFGGDRATLLALLQRDYPDTGVLVRGPGGAPEGFAFLKPGEAGSELGPLVMARPDPVLAADLLDGALAFRLRGEAASVECTIPAGHPFLGALLEARGFRDRGAKPLMARGAPAPQDWLRCGALAGLEKG